MNRPDARSGWIAARRKGPWHRALLHPLIGRFAIDSIRDVIRVHGTNSLCYGDGCWRYWRAPDDLPRGARLCKRCEGIAAKAAKKGAKP